jgi:hypothetical protein
MVGEPREDLAHCHWNPKGEGFWWSATEELIAAPQPRDIQLSPSPLNPNPQAVPVFEKDAYERH